MERLFVTATLKPDSFQRVQEILSEGPPFDLGSTSLERHQVFLGREELVMLFEGPGVEYSVPKLVEDQDVLGRATEIANHLLGPPRLPEPVFSWERPAELEGVSFGGLPGPGDSDGG